MGLGGSGALMAGPDQGALSATRRLCIEHSRARLEIHPALRIWMPRTGAAVADLRNKGLALCASLVAGARRQPPRDRARAARRAGAGDLNIDTGKVADLSIPGTA